MKTITVYHGSYVAVILPDLEKCDDGKDFGKGFYTTTSKKQAEGFCNSAVGKALKNGKITRNQNVGYVSVYQYNLPSELECYDFFDADAVWLKCVAGHRKKSILEGEIEKWQKYDIISGKIANDDTNKVITNYINGDYGNPEDVGAVEIALKLLKPNRLVDQICFKSHKALNILHYIESYEVEIK